MIRFFIVYVTCVSYNSRHEFYYYGLVLFSDFRFYFCVVLESLMIIFDISCVVQCVF